MISVHPTAVVHANAQIGSGCLIGPYCVIGEHVTLGAGCKLHSHVVIDGHTRLGERNQIFPFASIGLQTQDLKWQGGITRTEIGDDNTFREYVTINSATRDGEVGLRIGQGFDMGRPSLLLTRVLKEGVAVISTHVGGNCVQMREGTVQV